MSVVALHGAVKDANVLGRADDDYDILSSFALPSRKGI